MATETRRLHTKAIHGGLDPAAHRGAVSVPIYQSATFAFPSAEEGAARFAGSAAGPIYTRMGNPTVQALQSCLAELEEGCGAVATATGMAAVSAVFLALLRGGDHVVATHPLYGSSRALLTRYFSRLGVTSTFVAANDSARYAARRRHHVRFDDRPASGLARAPRHPHARDACRAGAGERHRHRPLARTARGSGVGPIPWPPLA